MARVRELLHNISFKNKTLDITQRDISFRLLHRNQKILVRKLPLWTLQYSLVNIS